MRGKNPAVLEVELLNPYNGIDASRNERHLIRDVQGQPLRRGIFVDNIYDIGRIENVHFNPWWSMKPRLFRNGSRSMAKLSSSAEATGSMCSTRSASAITSATSSSKPADGVCNGNFLGIGADDCYTALVVDNCAPFGLLISNGEFVSFHGPDPTMARVEDSNSGSRAVCQLRLLGAVQPNCQDRGKGHGRIQRLHFRAVGPCQGGTARAASLGWNNSGSRLRVPRGQAADRAGRIRAPGRNLRQRLCWKTAHCEPEFVCNRREQQRWKLKSIARLLTVFAHTATSSATRGGSGAEQETVETVSVGSVPLLTQLKLGVTAESAAWNTK